MSIDPNPLVSVISVFYNRAEYVAKSVQSLINQDYSNLEIILVDDGSSDHTLAALRQFAEDDRVKIVSHKNVGFVRSINAAIRNSSGRYIAIHGSGDISYPARLSKQAAILSKHTDVGVIGSHILNAQNFGALSSVVKPEPGLAFRKTLIQRNLFSHGEVMFRRSIYEQVGGYREFFKFAQDRDLWLRMSRYCDYSIVPEILYERKILDEGVGSTLKKLILQAYLSDFAVQCAIEIDQGRPDLLEVNHHLAPFLRSRSRPLALRFASIGIRWMLLRDEAEGWALLRRAKQEASTPKIAFYYYLGATHKIPKIWSLMIKPALRKKIARG
ncbi:MAG: glycosyltransferase [Pontixanthobacter sp.]